MTTFFEILTRHADAFARGLGVTLLLAVIVWAAGLVVGTLLGVLAAKFKRVIGLPTRLCSFMLSGVPALVFLFWVHYPLQALLGVVIAPFYTAAFVLATINIVGVSDVVSTHLEDFPREYIIAARVCGLSTWTTIRRIQLPIIVRLAIPPILALQVVMLQSTLFASLISVEEVFRVAQRVNAIEYKPIHIYSAVAVLFLGVSLPANGLAIWLHRRFTRNLSDA